MTNRAKARHALRGVERAVRVAARPAAGEGLDVLRDGVERRAPVGETGALARSVRVEPAESREAWVGGAVVVDSDHAAAQEFGTSEMPAQPFVRPTADADGARALRALADGIRRRL